IPFANPFFRTMGTGFDLSSCSPFTTNQTLTGITTNPYGISTIRTAPIQSLTSGIIPGISNPLSSVLAASTIGSALNSIASNPLVTPSNTLGSTITPFGISPLSTINPLTSSLNALTPWSAINTLNTINSLGVNNPLTNALISSCLTGCQTLPGLGGI